MHPNSGIKMRQSRSRNARLTIASSSRSIEQSIGLTSFHRCNRRAREPAMLAG
jgi:hypothetical protein